MGGFCAVPFSMPYVWGSHLYSRGLLDAPAVRLTHSLCLLCGSVSLLSMFAIHNQYVLLVAMIGFGVAWASALSMPYAMLTGVIPDKQRGIYQGIFNIFVVLPEIAVALGCGWVMQYLLHENRLMAVVLGGVFLLIAAALTLLVEINPSVVPAPAVTPLESENLPSGEKSAASGTESTAEDQAPVIHRPLGHD